MATCHLHPDRETFRSCTRCGRPTCPSCLRDAAVGAHCTTCVKADRGPVATQVKREVKMRAAVNGIVTPALVAINVAVHLYTLTQKLGANQNLLRYNTLAVRFGMDAYAVKEGEWYRVITAGFLHGGLLHLGFNMFALWNIGRMLERSIGRLRYLLVYVISIVAGSAGVILLQPKTLAIGASGGVFGLMGFAALVTSRRGHSLGSNPIIQTIVINLIITFSIPGISIGGHLGGLAGGALCGAMLTSPGFRRVENETRDIAALLGVLALVVVMVFVGVARLAPLGRGF